MKIPQITIHGRFQPPLHINHRNYIMDAFHMADKVIILITNPYLNEADTKESSHRNNKEDNPFTYKERVKIFTDYFNKIGILKDRYEFKPFNITDKNNFRKTLKVSVPNLVNVYGAWSKKKEMNFRNNGFKVVCTHTPKEVPCSGIDIRNILRESISDVEKKNKLLKIGYVPEAIEGLFRILNKK